MNIWLRRTNLLPWKQKGRTKEGKGTKEQLVIDKVTMKDSKAHLINLTMGWIDYRKAYGMVHHTWIHECLEMHKVNEKIRHMMRNSIKTWRTVLECVQDDSLSPLLFVMAMIPLTSILRRITPGCVQNKTKINHLLYMDHLKLFGKTKRDMESLMNTVRLFSKDIRM